MAQVGQKIVEATEQLRMDEERELELERKRSVEAVEKEKAKMRKLVRALANREKKLLAKKPVTASSSSMAPNAKTTPTARGLF
jgi:hypothetical protein